MIKRIVEFWTNSYRSDRTAFAFELVSFLFTVAASLTLAMTAYNPNMVLIYPGFFVGSITGAYAFYRRKLAWPMLLTGYFAVVNVFGFSVAKGFW
jgi:hypothetical protein